MNPELSTFLSEMGLTEYEAKTLAALFQLKEADSPEVSHAAQVPKTRVYDVLDKLVARGMVISIFSRPKKYRALAASEVFQKLMEEKRGDLDKLAKRAENWGKQLDAEVDTAKNADENVFKVKSRGDFYKILAQEMDGAQKEVIGLTALDVHHHVLHDALQRAAERNVSVKLAGEHPESFMEALSTINKNGAIHTKRAAHGLHAYVIDGSKVIMMLSDTQKDKPEYHFSIWNHHPSLANTLKSQFERVWNPPRP